MKSIVAREPEAGSSFMVYTSFEGATPTDEFTLTDEELMKTSPLRLGAALFVLAGFSQFANAQVITDGFIQRGLTYPGPASHDGEPWTQRYSYTTGAYIFINGDSRQLRYLDYLDRADRARKFGYRMPIDPYFPEVPIDVVQQPNEPIVVSPPPAQPRVFFGGGGFGLLRRR